MFPIDISHDTCSWCPLLGESLFVYVFGGKALSRVLCGIPLAATYRCWCCFPAVFSVSRFRALLFCLVLVLYSASRILLLRYSESRLFGR